MVVFFYLLGLFLFDFITNILLYSLKAVGNPSSCWPAVACSRGSVTVLFIFLENIISKRN